MTGWRLEFADRPLAGGFKFVCTHICMDWKASAEAFHLPWSFKNIGAEAGICHLCHWTCAGPEVYSRFHLHDYGPCRSTFLYLLSPSAGLSPWAALPGFGLYQIVGELMHCDCLGVCVYTIGSALVEFCRCGWFGGRILVRRAGLSWKERLDLQLLCAYKRFNDFLKNRGRNCSHGKLTANQLGMRVQGSTPQIKAKASNAMWIVDWLALEANKQARGSPSQYASLRATMLWGLSSFNKVVRLGKAPWMTAYEKAMLRQSRDAFLLCYHDLRLLAAEQRSRLWPITPKFHMFNHCESGAQTLGLSLRALWTFRDEDNMGVLQRICCSAHGATVSPTALSKWCMQWFERHME